MVLVIEDNKDMNRFLVENLSEEYRVESAHDGNEGLRKATELKPDLILCDIMMRGISGDELVRKVRSNDELAGIPIMLLSAKADDDLRVKLLREGAQDYLIKPFSVEELRARVRNLVAMEQAERNRRLSENLARLNLQLQEEVAERARSEERRAKLEDQFRQAQKMEAIGRLAGGVAHDFNNLLTTILGYCEILLMRKQPEPDRGNLDEIRMAAERASRLTAQLLAFSRKQVLLPKVLDLNALIDETQKMLGRLIGEDIELEVALHPEVAYIKADPGQVEQVIMNLAINARDAMPGGGKLTIETHNVELDASYAGQHIEARTGPHVMLAVTDTGIGMDRETVAHLFEPFFTTKEQGKGTGLGLSTVYGIVKQSGGSIGVYSEPGKGTSFKVYFPPAGDRPEQRPAAPQVRNDRGNETILLVEDDDAVRQLSKRILEGNGYTVVEAAHGAEALAVSEKHNGQLHLLVTDLIMPQVGGRELAARISSKRPDLPVLFMSGYTEDAVVHHGVLEKDLAFIQKPFTPATLARRVREILDRAQASRRPAGGKQMS
jgi:signal transduction histidine kinase